MPRRPALECADCGESLGTYEPTEWRTAEEAAGSAKSGIQHEHDSLEVVPLAE